MAKKLSWPVWLAAYGPRRLAQDLGINEKTAYNWRASGDLPKDVLKREIVKLSDGMLDFNSFFEV